MTVLSVYYNLVFQLFQVNWIKLKLNNQTTFYLKTLNSFNLWTDNVSVASCGQSTNSKQWASGLQREIWEHSGWR